MSEVFITIKGGGLSFEKIVSMSQAGQIISFLGNHSEMGSSKTDEILSPLPQVTQSTISPSSKIAPREFLNDSGAKTYSHRVLALGKFFLSHRSNGAEYFTKKNIQDLLQEARVKPSSKISRDFDKASQEGWIHETDKGKYWITQTGEEVLTGKFTSIPKTRTIKNPVKSSSSARKSGQSLVVRTEINDLEIFPKMNNLPDYWGLGGGKNKKILWILGVAKQLGATELSNSEINFIAQKKLDDTPFSNVAVFMKGLRRKGLVISQNGKHSIHKHGLDFLTSSR